MLHFNPSVIMYKRDNFIFVRRAVIIQGLDGLGSEKNSLVLRDVVYSQR